MALAAFGQLPPQTTTAHRHYRQLMSIATAKRRIAADRTRLGASAPCVFLFCFFVF